MKREWIRYKYIGDEDGFCPPSRGRRAKSVEWLGRKPCWVGGRAGSVLDTEGVLGRHIINIYTGWFLTSILKLGTKKFCVVELLEILI